MGPANSRPYRRQLYFVLSMAVTIAAVLPAPAHAWKLVGWSSQGLESIDPDYSVWSLSPPRAVLIAQVVDASGALVTSASGVRVTYEAVADADGSINTTSVGKSNFWEHSGELLGQELSPDVGLGGASMPGLGNAPQPMRFDTSAGWFIAEGIPITPVDDAGHINPYPLMRLVARDAANAVLATTDVTLTVSDEMSCAACHGSGKSVAAQPSTGWANDPDPIRDYRLNVLRLHDDDELGGPEFTVALATLGYDPAGLAATVAGGKSVLCGACHASASVPGRGIEGISTLSHAIHKRMAYAADPESGLPLAAEENRTACLRCHPGEARHWVRGPMGQASSADASATMNCQSCHGSIVQVADAGRRPWVDEPSCQNCHSGTARGGSGPLRFTSALLEDGTWRQPLDARFATEADTPVVGASLFQLSRGHGGLYCSACHGPAHAEQPTSSRNDNVQAITLQGHAGPLSECATCHTTLPRGTLGGPHGLHPLGQSWVGQHGSVVERQGVTACRVCHGDDDHGTELSRAQADRTLQTEFGTKHFWRGFQVGCYACHRGPSSESANTNRAPVVEDVAIGMISGRVQREVTGRDADGDAVTFRVISQPKHGRAGLEGTQLTIAPEPGYSGVDELTYAAWDGAVNSNLGTITFSVEPSCGGDCDGSGDVTVDEILRGVNIALGAAGVGECTAMDTSDDGVVTVDEILAAVSAALAGCS